MMQSLRHPHVLQMIGFASDGEASDGNVSVAMREFRNLPVWIAMSVLTPS